MLIETDHERFICVDGKRIGAALPPGLDSRNVVTAGRLDFIEIVDHAGAVVDLRYFGRAVVNMARLHTRARCLALLAILLIAAPAHAEAPPIGICVPCRVTEIVDGDTLSVDVTFRVRVRLADIQAPESRGGTLEERDAAKASTLHLEKFALDQPAVLYVSLIGRPTLGHLFSFERLVGRVYVYGQDIGERQIADGHARRAGK